MESVALAYLLRSLIIHVIGAVTVKLRFGLDRTASKLHTASGHEIF